jgi:uncharacterized protein YbbK (DUF523 family)
MSSSSIRIMEAPPEIAGGMSIPLPHRGQGMPAWNTPATLLERALHFVVAACRHVSEGLKTPRKTKAMRLCETVSLGEKRFLAIVQVDEERILIGGSASSVSLLTRLPEKEPFSAALLQRSQPAHSA